MKVVQGFVKSCDIFGQKVDFNYKKQETYKTGFGGFASLIIIVVLIVFFQSNVLSFFAKININVSQTTEFQDFPDQITLNEENYMIALQIEQQNFTINPYFNITVVQQSSTRLENGTMLKTTTEINLIPCSLDRFQKVFSKFNIDFKSQYYSIGLQDYLCPDLNYSMKLRGRFANREFNYIKVTVSKCNNDTSQNSIYTWKPVCKSEESIQSYLQTTSAFKVSLYMTNLIVNPSSPQNFVSAYLDDELYFTFTPKLLQRQGNIFWRKYNFETDESLTPFKNVINETFYARTAIDFRDLTLLGADTDVIYAQFYLRRSTFNENIQRNYQKVDDLMSYLGGFLQIMIVFFGFFIQVYNKQSQLVDLSNELFDFDIDDENKKPLLSNPDDTQQQILHQNQSQSMVSLGFELSNQGGKDQIINSAQQQIRNSTQELFLSNLNLKNYQQQSQKKFYYKDQLEQKHKDELEKNRQKTGKQYFYEQIQKLFEKQVKIEFTLKYLIKRIFCQKALKSQEERLLNKAINQVNSELDLLVILNKIQELDKLKDLLLKKPQQIIFNFTPKPLIALKEQKIFPNRQLIHQSSMQKQPNFVNDMDSSIQIGQDNGNMDQLNTQQNLSFNNPPQRMYSKLFKAYEKISVDIDKQTEDGRINVQLMKSLSPQIQNIFEVTQLLEYQEKLYKQNELIQISNLFKK
ncbi:unnamed protein product [Paramecium octaurelia]|uniref:Transmembrane protein n=1 Tax=Paramecium octaurelia TaxID=43137 RepID=A0A8S1V3J4_PAROT|nr:unnamed protein product [Paramecium octaurelia]